MVPPLWDGGWIPTVGVRCWRRMRPSVLQGRLPLTASRSHLACLASTSCSASVTLPLQQKLSTMSEDYSWGSVASSQASERATMETADWSGEEDAWSESHQQEIPIFREIFGYDHVPL